MNNLNEIECRNCTVIIRNTALDQKFPGGRKGFTEKHQALFNKDITVTHRTYDDIEEVWHDLREHKIVQGTEWAQFDVDEVDPNNIWLGVPWLIEKLSGGLFYVRYTTDVDRHLQRLPLEIIEAFRDHIPSFGRERFMVIEELLWKVDEEGIESILKRKAFLIDQLEYLKSLC